VFRRRHGVVARAESRQEVRPLIVGRRAASTASPAADEHLRALDGASRVGCEHASGDGRRAGRLRLSIPRLALRILGLLPRCPLTGAAAALSTPGLRLTLGRLLLSDTRGYNREDDQRRKPCELLH